MHFFPDRGQKKLIIKPVEVPELADRSEPIMVVLL